MTQKNLRANPRCEWTSPSTGRRCVKAAIHTRVEEHVVHQNGDLIWSEVGDRIGGGQCESTSPVSHRRCSLDLGHDLNPGVLVSSHVVHRNGPYSWGIGIRTGKPRMEEINPEVTSPLAARGFPAVLGDPPQLIADSHTRFNWVPESAEDRFQVRTSAEDELRAWWLQLAGDEIDRTVPKAVEYSSTDLADIGHQLARTAGRTVSDEEAAELGVYFYLLGKLSRWSGAIANGQRPSDDTLFDLGVYVRMAQRIRATGGWPGVPKPTEAQKIFHSMCDVNDPCGQDCRASGETK